ncbi:MAG: autotransporter outer membrane beta-barrel domain-containing protein [Thermoguttaceae bacterium]|nr:autotransporter outer membrane beta-barrel domain-containing protein [Thermoguttaceae bacterium]
MRFSTLTRRFASFSRLATIALGVCAFAAASLAQASIFPEDVYAPSLERRGVFEEYLGDEAPIEPSVGDLELEQDTALTSRALGVFTEELYKGFEERDVVEEASGYYAGNAFGEPGETIVRGSVNLPSIKSIQFWGNGYVGSGHVNPINGAGRVENKNEGAAVGLNLPIGLGTISAYYNYHRNRSTFSLNRVNQTVDGVGMAFYLNQGGFYATALGVYGEDSYKASAQGATARFSGNQVTGFVETGYEMATLGMFVLKPFCSYQYTNLKHGAFDTETLARLDGKRKYNSCLMTLGSRVDLNLAGLDVFTMEGRMAWITQLRQKNESVQTFNYGRVPGTVGMAQPYFTGDGAGSDFFWGGVGLRLSLWGALSVSADYDCLINKYQTLNEGSLSLLFGF